MIARLILRRAGGSIAVVLPNNMTGRFHLSAGDMVLAVETRRGILLAPYDPDTDEALRVASKVAGTYRKTLRELAE